MLARHSAVEWGVLRAHVVYYQTLQAGRAVPCEGVEIVADRMDTVTCEDGVLGVFYLVLARHLIALLQVDA